MNSKSRTFFRRTAASGNLILVLAIVALVMTTASADIGTTFTYQGQLLDGSSAVDDTCDIQFSLYDAATDGAQVGSTVTKMNVDVDNGLFTVELDFAGVFSGDPRWLELAVRCPAGSGAYDTLSPRQSIAPTPYAVYAAHASTASLASDVEPGAITPAHLNGLTGNGTSGQVLASDGSGGFGWQGVSLSPVKQLVQDFVTSGESVSAGDVVSFLNDQVYSPNAEWETESVFNAANTSHIAISALSATDFVVAYCDYGNSNYGTAITGTVSGETVRWGSASAFNSDHTTEIAVSSLSATDFVVVYRDWGNSSYGAAIVGTVSGGTLTWGTESVFNAALTFHVAISALSATEFVVAYRDAGNSGYGTARAGTVSGSSLTWGTESVFNAADTADIALSGLSATDFVVAYKDVDNSDYGTAIMGTVSGSTLSWGDESVFNAAGTGFIAVSGLSATDFVVAYRDLGNSDYGTARVGMVSGSTLSWGTESAFNAALTFPIAISTLSATDLVVAYSDWGNSEYGTARKCTVSGSSLTWGTESVFNTAATDNTAVSALSATVFVVVYRDEGSSDYGTARVGHHWQLVGTAKTAASGGETVTVIISGVSDVHIGLVPGKVYYLQADGSLGLTPTDYRIGLAISETELILDQLW
jgi:hypothetical protein